MYRKNEQHKQHAIFSSLDDLPDKQRERLESSWAVTFYTEFFCRIDEAIFEVLYSSKASRPNAPINVLVGLEVLKSGFGWSDAQLEDQLAYNVQVRYALGYRDLSVGHLELRTVYNFRRRVSDYMQATGINLLEQAFEQVTDEQIEAFALKTNKLRVDSTLVASNIRWISRLQLLVEVLQRTWRILSEIDRERYTSMFEPYVTKTSGQYTYHIENSRAGAHLTKIGEVMQELVRDLNTIYKDQDAYQILVRVFNEHFKVGNGQLHLKTGEELGSGNLQSPDDPGATYRLKRNEGYQGYVTNVTETCNPDNDIQLIVKVQTESNLTDDADLLKEAIPNLVARTDVDEVYTDGGYNSQQVDKTLQRYQIELYQSAIRGPSTQEGRLGVSDFIFERTRQGIPKRVRCPQGQETSVSSTYTDHRFRAAFDATICATCKLLKQCPTLPLKRRPHLRHLRFHQKQVNIAHRHANLRKLKDKDHNLRSAIEATIRSLKHPFGNGKLPVRGHSRMSMMMVASAAMTNIRRLWRATLAPRPTHSGAVAMNVPISIGPSLLDGLRFLVSQSI